MRLVIYIVIVLCFSPVLELFSQSRLSRSELRQQKIDSTFDYYEKLGYNSSGPLKYIYHFTDREEDPLKELGEDLEEDSIEVIIIERRNNRWHLAAFKNEIQSRRSMATREQELRWRMFKYKVDTYNGFNIAPADIDLSGIADDVFFPFLLSLSNQDLYNVGTRLDKLHSWPKSLIAFDELVKRNYRLDTSHYKMGKALIGTHEFVDGIEHWQQAIKLNPDYLEVHLELGKILFENSHWKEAHKSFNEADRIQPNDDEILYHLAKSLIKLERYNEAYDTIKRALKINPRNKYAKGVLNYLKEPQIRKLRHKKDRETVRRQ